MDAKEVQIRARFTNKVGTRGEHAIADQVWDTYRDLAYLLLDTCEGDLLEKALSKLEQSALWAAASIRY
jgi:hypothetical protein